MICVTPDRRASVLAVVAANEGVKATTCARLAGMELDTFRAVVRDLRRTGLIAPLGALVPNPSFDPATLTPRQADVHGWASDVLGSAQDCADALRLSYTRVRMVLTELRALGAIEPVSRIYTTQHVERRQDVAWDRLRSVRQLVPA